MPVVVPPTPQRPETLSLHDFYYMQQSVEYQVRRLKEEEEAKKTSFFELQKITALAKNQWTDTQNKLKNARNKLKTINKNIQDREEDRQAQLKEEREEWEEEQKRKKRRLET